jgi:cytochrome c peroxidase
MPTASRTWSASTWRSDDESKDGHGGRLGGHHASPRPGLPEDDGRASGARKVVDDEFNCLSRWSDAKPEDCTALRFLKVGTHEQERQFKVPSLRNVAERGPYMDAGQYATLFDVLNHYNTAPAAPAGHSEITRLNLSETQLRQLEAFLHTLSGPLATPPELLGHVTRR